MKATRRDLFKFIGGSAVGALFTPAPWRLITDTALWSENWPGIPRPGRGEIKARFTNCALCPAGCGVRARCVNEQPVSLAGVPSHPLSQGALCAFGLAGHHLPFSPERLKRGDAHAALEAISGAISGCAGNERIAVLDLAPGRTASWTYRRALAGVKNGLYIAAPQPLGGWAADLSKARTVISFGAPVLDGWGTPGNVLNARAHFRLVQVEPAESRTAVLADEWIRLQPSAVEAAAIVRERAAEGPVLVLSDWPGLLALNQPGVTVAPRKEAPVPESWKAAAPATALADVPNASIRALLIDESIPGQYVPWNEIQAKLAPENPVVVAFAPSQGGYGRHARFTLPTAVYPEAAGDIPPAVDCPNAVFRISAPLAAPPAGMADPAEFVAKLGGVDASNALRERADAVHKAGRGAVFTYADAKTTPVKELKPDDFWKALNEGACWIGDPAPLPARSAHGSVAIAEPRPLGSGREGLAVILTDLQPGLLGSPLLSKLYQESNLRLARNRALLHPDSARDAGVEDGSRAFLETPLGRYPVEIALDSSVPPGFVQAASSPEILDICGASSRAKVVRA